MYFHFSWVQLGVQWLGHMLSICLLLRSCQVIFPSGCIILIFKKKKSIGTLCYREARDHLLLTRGKQGQRDCDLFNITQDDSDSVWARQQSVAPSPALSDYIFLSNNSLGRLNLLLPLSRTIMDSSAKEITSVLPDFTLSAEASLLQWNDSCTISSGWS